MACNPGYRILEITDGTTHVNLLSERSGFCLQSWQPALAAPKGDGSWADNSLSDGRSLRLRKLQNVNEQLTLAVRNWSPDDLIRDTQNLRRLLEKATRYRTTDWQNDVVYIKRVMTGETNASYTLIEDYRTPQDESDPGLFWNALGHSAFPEFVLELEHEPWWRGDIPGEGTCVQASAQQDWRYLNGWEVVEADADSYISFLETATGALLYGSTTDIKRSVDGGDTWAVVSALPTTFVLSFLQASSGRIFAGEVGNIFYSDNDGVAWALNTALPGGSIHSMIQIANGDIFATDTNGLGTGDLWRSQNNGGAWASVKQFDEPRAVIQLTDLSMLLTDSNRIWRSTDNGVNWDPVWSFPDDMWALFEAADGTVWVSSGQTLRGVYHSEDRGLTWVQVPSVSMFTVRRFDQTSDSVIYAAAQIRLYKSVDNGLTWVIEHSIGGTSPTYFVYVLNDDTIFHGDASASPDQLWRLEYQSEYLMGRSATCLDEVYISNKQNRANISHIKIDDGGIFSDIGIPMDFSLGAVALFPAVPVIGDAVLFGIQTTNIDSGPFCSLVFDIAQNGAAIDYETEWQYSNGGAGWPALNVHDNTQGGFAALSRLGVNSVHWVPPSDWVPEAVDGVTAYWVRLELTALTGAMTSPTQQNRDVYTITWPMTDVDDAQVTGDLPLLSRLKLRNQSDEDGYEVIIDELDLLDNRILVGLRSVNRGETFTTFLNCSDEQNPVGVTASNGSNTSDVNDIDHPTGRSMDHTTTGAETWTNECTFTLGTTIARDFYGGYHAFFRGQLESFSSAVTDVKVRLQVRTGSGGVLLTSDPQIFPNVNDWQLIDFGHISIPAAGVFSGQDLGDQTNLIIQVWSSAATLHVNLYDLILVPVDEWAIDSVDEALENDSGITNGFYLDVDSLVYPKRKVRVLTRGGEFVGDKIRSMWNPITAGPAILQANTDQRLWFLTARAVVTGTHTGANNATTLTDSAGSFLTSNVEAGQVIYNVTDGSVGVVGSTVTATTISDCNLSGGGDNDWDTNDEYLIIAPSWKSEPWNAHSIQLTATSRYLSMRGAR